MAKALESSLLRNIGHDVVHFRTVPPAITLQLALLHHKRVAIEFASLHFWLLLRPHAISPSTNCPKWKEVEYLLPHEVFTDKSSWPLTQFRSDGNGRENSNGELFRETTGSGQEISFQIEASHFVWSGMDTRFPTRKCSSWIARNDDWSRACNSPISQPEATVHLFKSFAVDNARSATFVCKKCEVFKSAICPIAKTTSFRTATQRDWDCLKEENTRLSTIWEHGCHEEYYMLTPIKPYNNSKWCQ